jgi:hypothetical protein
MSNDYDDDDFSPDAFVYEAEARDYASYRYVAWIDAEVDVLAHKLMCDRANVSYELQKYIEMTLLDRIPAVNITVRRLSI